MTELATYNDAIIHTFRKRAVRSAILIDDSFPCFRDLLGGEELDAVKGRYKDWEDARDLLDFMHGKHVLCDVENDVTEVGFEFIERVRKSDLVVLDWNLVPDDPDNGDAAIRILDQLSDSQHFNLVVVYTRTPDLERTWAQAAIRLRRGWAAKEFFLNEEILGRDIDDLFDELKDDHAHEYITEELLSEYVVKGKKALGRNDGQRLKGFLRGHDIRPQHIHLVAEALVHRIAVQGYGASYGGGGLLRVVEGERTGTCPYLRCGSVFVTFMHKPARGDAPQKPPAHADIFECLDSALKAWGPSLLQLLVSELQNELEQGAYAFDGALFPSDALKVGWLYHSLKTYSDAGNDISSLDTIVQGLYARILDAIDSALSPRAESLESGPLWFGRQAAKLALEGAEAGDAEKTRLAAAKRLAGVEALDDGKAVHALNEYLSADVFRGGHITTGTVLCSEDAQDWFLCVSPACDMVPRQHKDPHNWLHSLFPVQPMHLLHLQAVGGDALADAEQGLHVFCALGDTRFYLRAVDGNTKQPRPMTCFLRESLPANEVEDQPWQNHCFSISVMNAQNGELGMKERRLFAVSQLRPAYAARFLHLASSHQSRVGVDYVDFGKKQGE